ncbi:NADH-quinone oxidoreductase subunit C [Streptomyces olivochromogenes]|uniref:NADH-quinone oxidoreductase subunit C n=1 Tax=Streptomyces olivochromogenes TaxID=1963 RepID=UPI001F441E2D|nr:NADH-quinone oxidoreductase subunit C [Streptomyces olivochromogenes]MCF3133089.1 NADH-quinone oxidoreductase subunit C [Streptomyces olivochromogenes]
MTTVGWLPAPVEELFGTEATAEESYEVLTVDVPPSSWLTALETARTTLSCTYFDWLSAVDEPGTGFRVSAHVVALAPVRRLLVRTTVPHEAPALPSAVGVYAGAAWHERETHEMFGVTFEGHPALDHLLLPETFEGHPLRKDFVLAARVAKAWPGAKEPGESDHGGPKRRQMLPPGVPDPNEWGPMKGQLPPAPARRAGRAAGRAAGDRPTRAAGDRPVRAAGERPPRRTRTAAEGSASQGAPLEPTAAASSAEAAPEVSASAEAVAPEASVSEQGGAAGTAAGATGPRRARSASGGSASQRAGETEAAEPTEATEPTEPAEPTVPGAGAPGTGRSTAARGTDAPWHHARPAFDEPEGKKAPQPEPTEPTEPTEAGRADAAPSAEESAPEASAPETPAHDDPTGGPQ